MSCIASFQFLNIRKRNQRFTSFKYMPIKAWTFPVLHLEISGNFFKFILKSNTKLIWTTFSVLYFDVSGELIKFIHLVNNELIFCIFEVSHFKISGSDFNNSHSLNKHFSSSTLHVFKLEIFGIVFIEELDLITLRMFLFEISGNDSNDKRL